MPNPNAFIIDYLPAEIHEAKSGWYIVYYVKHPGTNKLTRKRIKWNRIANITERRRTAKQLCQRINMKLASGWNPFIEQDAPKSFTLIKDAVDLYLKHQQKALKDQVIRPDTFRSYTSYVNNWFTWHQKNRKDDIYTFTITRQSIRDFLDYIYYERDNSPRTHNNYCIWFNHFGGWLVEKQFCKVNPGHNQTKKREGDKIRQVIPQKTLAAIFSETQKTPAWHTLCNTLYYCFIRRNELTLLQVKHVNLKEKYIEIPSTISKNRKTQKVAIPQTLGLLLTNHLNRATNKNWYLFSADDFLPGPQKLAAKKISDTWANLRKKLNLTAAYQFYSLKDTGITNMLSSGIDPLTVRDQARHHDISITNKYTSGNNNVKNNSLLNL